MLNAAFESGTDRASDDPILTSNLAGQPPSVTVGPLFAVSDVAASTGRTFAGVGDAGETAIGWDSSTARLRRFNAADQPQGGSVGLAAREIADVEFDSLGRTITTGRNQRTQEALVSQFAPDGQLIRSTIPNSAPLHARNVGDSGVDAAGNVVVTWSEINPSGLFGQRLDANLQKVGGPFLLNSSAQTFVEDSPYVLLAMNASGDFVVTWDLGGIATSSTSIYARRFHADGTAKGDQFIVNPTLGGENRWEHVAMDAEGNFVVVWWHATSDSRALYGQWFDADGNRRGGEQNLSVTLAQEALPRIAMDGVGNSLLVWSRDNLTIPMAQAFGPDGQKLGSEIQLGPATSTYLFPNIATNDAGEAIASWETGSQVFARRLTFGYDTVIDLNGGASGRDYRAQRTPGGGSVAIVDAAALTVTRSSATNLVSAKISIGDYRPGDLLTINTSGTNISASFADGVLSLNGATTVAQYQKALRTVRLDTTATRPASSIVEVAFVVNDGSYDSNLATSRIENYVPGSATVAARRLFYNESMFDFNDPAIGNPDDKATPNKSAYLPGSGVATFASVSSYSKGINGIMIDLAGVHGEISLADLEFRVGTSPDPADWTAAPTPSAIALRPGWGPGGTDRLEVVWPNNSIRNQWLEVRVKANAHTGLASDDLFYWGNRVGDVGAGTPAAMFVTSAADATATWNKLGSSPFVDTLYDFNRDGQVTAADKTIAMNNLGSLVRLNLGNVAATVAGDFGIASALAATLLAPTDVRPLAIAPDSSRAAVAAEVEIATRVAGPAQLMTVSTRSARLTRAADVALSLEVEWDEPAAEPSS